jgi:uncharacterized protein (DUF2147 family)
MKRFCYVAALMMLCSSAYAGSSFSFVVGGHRIHIEAPRHCRAASCVSVSIPGVYEAGRKRDRDDADDAGNTPPPAKPPEQVLAPPAAPVTCKASTVASAPPPASPVIVKPSVVTKQESAAPPPPVIEPPKVVPPPPLAAPVEKPIAKPIETARPAPDATTPRISKALHEIADAEPDTPLGDWQTEGKKGSVRIEQCGHALCGYVLDSVSGATGNAMLINMEPKTASVAEDSSNASEWSGSIYSRNGGRTYYATVAIKGPNSLRVEACALGRFFCSGNNWNRIAPRPASPISSSRQFSPQRS